jgi:hypothetical protein
VGKTPKRGGGDRVNVNDSIIHEVMETPGQTIYIGDVRDLVIRDSRLQNVVIAPKTAAQGTIQSSTYAAISREGPSISVGMVSDSQG